MKYRVAGFISLLSVLIAVASCESEQTLEFKRYYSAGSQVYELHCQNCHGAKGEGLSALIPPLNDSVYLKNHKTALACYVNFGLKGAITINAKAFEGTMPSNGLAPMEIA